MMCIYLYIYIYMINMYNNIYIYIYISRHNHTYIHVYKRMTPRLRALGGPPAPRAGRASLAGGRPPPSPAPSNINFMI